MTKIRNTVGAYKILLSANPIFTSDLASKIKTSTDLLGMYGSDKYSTVFSSEDAGFIELKHDFNFKTGQNNNGPKINLKTYDPGLKFLNELYFDFTSRSLSKLADSEELEQSKLKTYYHDIEDKKFAIYENENQIRLLEGAILAGEDEYQETVNAIQSLRSNSREAMDLSRHLNRINKTLKSFRDDLSETKKTNEELELSIDELQESIATVVSYRTLPKVHIMYGVGNDIRHWAGPFECYLGDTKYSNNGKEETVEYIFATDITSMGLTDSNIRSPKEWKTFFSETSVPVMAYYLTNAGFHEPIYFSKKSLTVHDCIIKLMSNYLYKLGIKNHLLVFPNLDSLLSACIDNSISRVIHQNAPALKDAGWEFGYKTWIESYQPVDTFEGTEREQVIFSRITNIFSHNLKALKELLGVQDQKPGIGFFGGGPIKRRKLLNRINLQIIMEIFASIGIGKKTTNPPDHDGPIPVFTTGGTGDPPDPIKVKNPFDITTAGSPGEVEGHHIYSINFGNKYSWGEKASVDWIAPIQDMVDGINSNAASRYISFEAAFIHDVKVVEKVREKFGGGSYVGYCNEALTPAPPIDDTPFLILGDKDLINNIVYGDYARVSDDPNYTDPNYLSQDLDFITMEGRGTSYTRDPFWKNIFEDVKKTRLGHSNYIFDMYKYLKNASELNLGYHNGIIKTKTSGKHLEELAAQIPDEFGYFRDEEQLAFLYEEKLPIFRAGVTNANVLSYSFDADKFIYGSLVGTVREIYYNVSKAYLRKDNPIAFDGTLSEEELREKLIEVGDALRAKRLFSGRGLTARTGASTPAVPEEVYDEIAKLYLADSLGPARRYRKGKASSVLGFFMLFIDCFERQYLGTIKTLPMFHLSKHSNILQPCLSLIKGTRRVHTSTFHRGDSSVSDFFCGQFRLLGFAHTIGRSSAYSEFSIQKDVVGDLNNE